MPDFPILLNLENRLCVVVGGGAVGLRKVRSLLEAGARVRLIAPEPAAPVKDLENVETVRRCYRRGDLKGAFLAFAATDDREVNAAVLREARETDVLANLADAPADGDFTLPALLRRGDLTVSVSTGGRSPALAALVRDRLNAALGPEWAAVVEIAAALRRKRLTVGMKTEYNLAILRRLLDGGLPDLIAGRNSAGIDHLLEALFGEGFSLAELGIHLPKEMT
jgi:precorrin-2 dehydrogenase/sirohydrochlorin ferrochelatase